MLRFIASLFGCAHSRCTFPSNRNDWEQMKVVGSAKGIHHAIAQAKADFYSIVGILPESIASLLLALLA